MILRIRRIRIRGQYWRLVVKRPPGRVKLHGLCDYAARTIYVHPSSDIIATTIHEVLHAALPDLTEQSVSDTEEAVMNAIEVVL